jgi:5-methylcytosine-specific restriction endonuclease McrA
LKIPAELRTFVVQRATFRCEYCLIHQDDAAFSHEVDHVISRQHGGQTIESNLAFACMVCNRYKGANIASVADAGSLVRLFNPRESTWAKHFRLNGAIIEPLDV